MQRRVLAVLAAATLALAGCSAGDLGSSDDSGSATTISFLATPTPA
jgi:ABC-type glycerol-3-phosphate transport system substrate-binding protein